MKYFKYKESWKHLYSQRVYTQHLEFNINILLYLIYHISIHTYIFLYKHIYFKDFQKCILLPYIWCTML